MAWVKVGSLADGFVLGPGLTIKESATPPPPGTPTTTITIVV